MEPEPDNYIYLASSILAITPIGLVLSVLLVVLLLVCSALISGSEIAFFSLTPNDFKTLEEEDSPSAKRILALKKYPDELLATILISNNFINIGIVLVSDLILQSIISEELCSRWARVLLDALPFPICSVSTMSAAFHFSITVVFVTFLLVLFGEVMPKVYAKINNIRLARFMSRTLTILMNIFTPLSSIMVKGTSSIERLLTARTQNGSSTSREDIDHAIDLAVGNEKLAKEDSDILKGIVKFGDVAVKQIMHSRVDVVAIDFRISYHELLKIIRESGYSRIPVYDEDFDNVTGILYVKDLLTHLHEDAHFEWQTLIRTNVFYVPEAKKIDDLLREFQSQRLHMAIVVDEYGGSAGIVTLEDIMEEIIGEIKDEFDDEMELEYRKIDDFNYIFEGKTLLNDVCRVIGVDTSTFDEVKGDADSVAGLLLEMKGLIPRKGEVLEYNKYHFKVEAVNKRRIEEIRITLPKE